MQNTAIVNTSSGTVRFTTSVITFKAASALCNHLGLSYFELTSNVPSNEPTEHGLLTTAYVKRFIESQ